MQKDSSNYVEFLIPLDIKWLHSIEMYAQLYVDNVGFNQRLATMVTQSVNEACGELFERAAKTNSKERFRLSFNSNDYAVELAITYNGRIPLNPYKEKSFEVPPGEVDLESINTDSLWLYMIKCRMDRIYFDTEGKNQTLRIIKYHREEGKEKQLWVLGQKPSIKSGLNIDIALHGNTDYVGFIQDFHSANLLRLGAVEMHAILRFDGKTTLYDIYMDAICKELKTSPLLYANLYEELEKRNMLQIEESKSSRWNNFLTQLRNMTYSIPNSDKLVSTFYNAFRLMFTNTGVCFIFFMMLLALYPIIHGYEDLKVTYANLFTTVKNNWIILLYFFIINSIIICIHELSHGAACKKYKGNVPYMGISYYLSSIIFFCDVSTSYNFPKKIQRIIVVMAGPLSTLLIWSIISWCAYFAVDIVWQTVSFMLLISTTLSLIMNCNPFIKMDAYYIASDLLGISNLRPLAFNVITNKLKKIVGIKPVELVYSKEKRGWLWGYGIISSFITILFCIIPVIRFISYTSSSLDFSIKLLWMCAIILLIFCNLSLSIVYGVKSLRHQVFKIK